MSAHSPARESRSLVNTLPDELAVQIVGHVENETDLAHLRATCRTMHRVATELLLSRRDTKLRVQSTEGEVEKLIASYLDWPQLGSVIRDLKFEFTGPFKLWRNPDYFSISNLYNQFTREDEMKLIETDEELAFLVNQPQRTLQFLRLLPRLHTVELHRLISNSLGAELPWTTLHTATQHLQSGMRRLILSDCRLSSGHIRLLLSAFPQIKQLTLKHCVVTDGWSSLLSQLVVLGQLHAISLTPSCPKDEPFFSETNQVDRGETFRRQFRVWQQYKIICTLAEANGPLAVDFMLRKILTRWLGAETLEKVVEGGRQEWRREKEMAASFADLSVSKRVH